MTSSRSILGSLSSRRLATVVAIVGIAFVGRHLASVWPRDLGIAYEVDPEVERLDVDYLQEGEAVASVRFVQRGEESPVFHDTVRLQPGEYQIHITLHGPRDTAATETRRLVVPTEGLTRIDLKSETLRSE